MKLKNSNCEKTLKSKFVTKLKTEIVTKLKNSNCDKTKKKANCDKTQKLKL